MQVSGVNDSNVVLLFHFQHIHIHLYIPRVFIAIGQIYLYAWDENIARVYYCFTFTFVQISKIEWVLLWERKSLKCWGRYHGKSVIRGLTFGKIPVGLTLMFWPIRDISSIYTERQLLRIAWSTYSRHVPQMGVPMCKVIWFSYKEYKILLYTGDDQICQRVIFG